MKSIVYFLFCMMALISSACSKYDDTKVWNELNRLDSRVERLETLCSQMNTNISSLQAIVAALQKNDGITNIYQLPNGEGYTITFTSGKTITIYNGVDGKDGKDGVNGSDGKDGSTPVVGVKKDADGIYYWTLNGEWLTDNTGNRIKAVGADGRDGENGKDGITPQLKIEDGYWYVSTDNGSAWTMIGKATGDNGVDGTNGKDGADGKDGDSMFSSVVENEDNVVFTLADGTQITVDKSKSLSISFEASEIGVEAGKSREIVYALTGASGNVKVKVAAQDGWSAKVTSVSQAGGVIKVTAPETAEESEVIVFVNDGNNTIMSSFACVPSKVTIMVSSSVGIDMVFVEPGTFTMGADDDDSDAFVREKPAHKVTLTKSYWIGKYEVTQELWNAVMGNNPSTFSGTNLPVEGVSWNDCQTFIDSLNVRTGKLFRLPTEAEWEYAARGGNKSQGYKYSGSDTIYDVAWYYSNSSSTHAVGTKAPNELGIYDMSGNVLEWCQDWYGSYTSDAQTNPTGADSASLRVGRGGGWNHTFRGCRCSNRISSVPGSGSDCTGLRLALSE